MSDLFVHGYFVYEFLAVAAAWGFLALEAALREILQAERGPGSPSLTKLIGMAQAKGLLTSDEAEQLRAGASLRNRLMHPERQAVDSPGMSAQALATTFDAIARLYGNTR